MKKLITVALFLLLAGSSYADPLPAVRTGNWDDAGVTGGIPSYSGTIDVTDSPYNCVGNGVADDGPCINSALSSAGGNTQIVYLPPGTYLSSSTTINLQADVMLKGAGTSSVIMLQGNRDGIEADGGSWSSALNLSQDASQGDTHVFLSSASGLSADDYFIIDVLNAQSDDVDPSGSFTCGNWCYKRADAHLAEMGQIASISGTDITLTAPIMSPYGYSVTNTAQLSKMNPVTGVGIESLKITRSDNQGSAYMVRFTQSADSWMKDVEINPDHDTKHMVRLQENYRLTFDRMYIHNTYTGSGYGGDHSYGIAVMDQTSGTLIINSIFDHLRHSVVYEGAGAGNVTAFSYSASSGDQSNFLMADGVANHGAHNFMTLFEGNWFCHYSPDKVGGSSGYGTAFGNYFVGDSDRTDDQPDVIYGRRTTEVMNDNRYYTFIGNALGNPSLTYNLYITTGTKSNSSEAIHTPGYGCDGSGCDTVVDPTAVSSIIYADNYDYYNDTVMDTDGTAPDSYFLSSAPDFFTDNGYAWPWLDPAGGIDTETELLPAKERYDAGTFFVEVDQGGPPLTGPESGFDTGAGGLGDGSGFEGGF